MIASLPLFHRIAGQTILVIGDGEAADAKRRLVIRAGAKPTDDIGKAQAAGARLAFIALEDDAEAKKLVEQLRQAGMLVNAPDRPELCDFTVPSILDRDPVLIAVGTGGASAGLAKHLRLRLERILPRNLGDFARALFANRAKLRGRIPNAAERRQALDAALSEGGILDPLIEHSADDVAQWAEDGEYSAQSRRVEIALSSDDPDDLTLRQARLLGEAETIVLVGKIAPKILARARADAQILEEESINRTTGKNGLTLIVRGVG